MAINPNDLERTGVHIRINSNEGGYYMSVYGRRTFNFAYAGSPGAWLRGHDNKGRKLDDDEISTDTVYVANVPVSVIEPWL